MGLKEKNEFAKYVADRSVEAEEGYRDIEPGKPVYHYTAFEGLAGILQKDALNFWLSCVDDQLDQTEGKDITTHYQNVCKRLFREGTLSQALFDHLINIEPSRYKVFPVGEQSGTPVLGQEEYDAYICCFCRNANSDNMWEHYAGHDGYNIQLRSLRPEHSRNIPDYKDLDKPSKIRKESIYMANRKIYPVIYDVKEKENIIEAILTELCSIYAAKEEELKNDIKYISDWIAQFLFTYKYRFKNVDYADEEEIRVVIYRPRRDRETKKIKSREKDGRKVFYIEDAFAQNCFRGIGIKSRTCKAKTDVLELLKERGHSTSHIYSHIYNI